MTERITHRFTIIGMEGDKIINLKATGTFLIGRQDGLDIQLKQTIISKKHAQLDATELSCHLTDLNSTNGIVIDGQRIPPNTPIKLNEAMLIEIGAFKLRYQFIQGPPKSPGVTVEESNKHGRYQKSIERTPQIYHEGPPNQPPTNGRLPQSQSNGHYYQPPPGLELKTSKYLQYLPAIYHPILQNNGDAGLREANYFIARLLALCESILEPIRWTTENFDLFLSPTSIPREFLPWLAQWFHIIFDDSWSEAQQRQLIQEAYHLYTYRGTKQTLQRLLEIYTTSFKKGAINIDIDDTNPDLPPFTFTVTISLPETQTNRLLIEKVINANKPAHTNYKLRLTG